MARLRFETDLGTSLKAGADLAKAYDKVGTALGKTAREAKALELAAKRIVDANLTPQERYNQKLEKMAKAVKAGKLSMDDAERTAGRLRQRLDETGKSGDKVFGASALASMKNYVLGIASVSQAIMLFRSEMDAIKAENEKITQSQLTAAAARDVLKRNIPATFTREQSAAVEQRSERLAAELGLPGKTIDVALAEALGSSDGNVELAFSRTRAAGRFLKTSPEGIPEFAGALGDVGKATRDPSAMRNLGFMLAVGAESRVTDDKKLAANLPPALAGAASFGATAEEGGALFDALSKAAADTEGRRTGTGVINMFAQLSEFFDEKVTKGKFEAEAVDTARERMQALRADPKLARTFADQASFESKVKGPMREFLLDPNSPISKEYERLLGSFGTAQSQTALAEDRIAYLNEGRIAGTAAIERTIEARTDQFRLGRDADLSEKSRGDIIRRYAQLTGIPETTAKAQFLATTGFTLSPEEAIEKLESRYVTGRIERGEVDPELAKNQREMIEELKGIRSRMEPQQAPRASGRQE